MLQYVHIIGAEILEGLENGVSQWPNQEGRFPQLSGASFQFDPRKPSGSRINPKSVKIQGEELDLAKVKFLIYI